MSKLTRASTGQFNSVDRWSGGMLLCTKCDNHMSPDLFAVDRRNKATGHSSWCKVCMQAWRAANREFLKQSKRQDYAENREKRLAVNLAAQRRNKSASNERSARWRELNPEKRKLAANSWVRRNPSYNAAQTSFRYAAKLKATPAWADKSAIQLVYDKAAEFGMWVDHVVPLVSDYVCGLHCEANLQLLAPDENIRKGNRFWPDMP